MERISILYAIGSNLEDVASVKIKVGQEDKATEIATFCFFMLLSALFLASLPLVALTPTKRQGGETG